MNKQVLTLATGNSLYVELANNLAKSFYYWNKNSGITFILVTDLPELVDKDILNFIEVLTIPAGKYGIGFSPKLHLDELAPIGSTLFIDSDCLIFGKIDSIFDRFYGNPVSVIGNYITEGDWYGDVKLVCERFKIPRIPKFNGGIYYIENGDLSKKVYNTARGLEKDYDLLGFQKFRNKVADEIIMSVAIQLHGMSPIKDDGTIMSDPFACPGKYCIDIQKGKTLLVNPKIPDPKHRPWYNFYKVSPIVVHFLGSHTDDYQYKIEVEKLRLLLKNKLNFFQKLKINFKIKVPEVGKIYLKNIFRPLYKSLFGNRKIQVSDRV